MALLKITSVSYFHILKRRKTYFALRFLNFLSWNDLLNVVLSKEIAESSLFFRGVKSSLLVIVNPKEVQDIV